MMWNITLQEFYDEVKQFAEKYNYSLDDPNLLNRYNHYRIALLDRSLCMADAETKGSEQAREDGPIKLLRVACELGLDIRIIEEMASVGEISREQARQIYGEVQAERGNDKNRDI